MLLGGEVYIDISVYIYIEYIYICIYIYISSGTLGSVLPWEGGREKVTCRWFHPISLAHYFRQLLAIASFPLDSLRHIRPL